MAKHRKTRKEKVISDQRKSPKGTTAVQAPTEALSSVQSTPSTPLFSVPTTSARTSTTLLHANEYDYVTKDLRKTALLTLSLIVAQVILAFVLKI